MKQFNFIVHPMSGLSKTCCIYVVIIVMLVLSAVSYGVAHYCVEQSYFLSQQNKSLRMSVVQLTAKLKKNVPLGVDLEKIKLYKAAYREHQKMIAVEECVAQSVVSGVKLSRFFIDAKQSLLSGQAYEPARLTLLVHRLNQCGFASILLNKLQAEKGGEVEFSIRCKLGK